MTAARHEEVRRFLAGRIPSKREELEHLQERVRYTKINHATWPSHMNEVSRAQAEQHIEDFMTANPQLREEKAT